MENIRFFHPTKTGGSSITKTLQTKFDIKHNHLPLFTKEQLKTYDFTFASVRNPYDRALDMYNYFKAANKKDLTQFLKALSEGEYVNHRYFFPQWMYVEVGDSKVDDLMRIETFEVDWNRVIKGKIGLDVDMIHLNPTKKIIRSKLTKKQKEMVYDIYKEDFILLGYDK